MNRTQTAQKLNTTLLYCNIVGGQDELVFDGASMVFAPGGTRIARAKQFQEDILYYEQGGSYRRLPACPAQRRPPALFHPH